MVMQTPYIIGYPSISFIKITQLQEFKTILNLKEVVWVETKGRSKEIDQSGSDDQTKNVVYR